MSDEEQSIDHNVVSSYLDDLHKFPQLKHPEVVELFKAFHEGAEFNEEGNVVNMTKEAKHIRERLVECNLRLVVSIAKQYKNHNIPIEDLIQEGNIGLMKAIERFKWEKGFRFSTYATWWIKQAIGQHVLKRKRMIRLPAHAATVQRKMMQASEEFRNETGHDPSAEELIDMLDASETVVKATMHSGRAIVSLQQPAHVSTTSGAGITTIQDTIVDERPGADPFTNVAEKELLDVVKRVLAKLSPKEAAILRLRFGLVESSTNSKEYPITQEEIDAVMAGNGLT